VPSREKGEAGFQAHKLAELMRNKRIRDPGLAKAIGTAAGTVSRWRRGLTTPTTHLVNQLAEFFGKPRDYFFDESAPKVSRFEEDLLSVARQLDDYRKGMLMEYAKRLLS
jgi:transcriptional regulator with XRE-family HTH domain